MIARARKHLEELDREVKAWGEGKPYVGVVEDDLETGDRVHFVRLVTPMPADVGVIIFDVFKNLRAALDNAVYAGTVTLAGGTPLTKFPFGEDADGFEGDMKRKCKAVPDAIKDTLRRIKPYKGGNNSLFVLNKVRNHKDHSVLIDPVLHPGDLKVSPHILRGPLVMFPTPWDSDKNEMVLFRVGPGGRAKYDVHIVPTVGLGNARGLEGVPNVGTFGSLIDDVETAVGMIEADVMKALAARA